MLAVIKHDSIKIVSWITFVFMLHPKALIYNYSGGQWTNAASTMVFT